jgi:hypothetical protein
MGLIHLRQCRTPDLGTVHKGRLSLVTVFALWSILIVLLMAIGPGNNLAWDGLGYYLYLPAFFIHHDPLLLRQEWLQHALDTYGGLGSGGFYQAHQVANGNWVMKYPMGMAILWSPFVFMAHLLASPFGYPADGFSRPYQVAIMVAGLTYGLLGLLMLRKALQHLFKDGVVAATLALVVVGTNYLHQTLYGSSMTHVYLFTLHGAVLLATIRWHGTGRRRYVAALSMAIGLAALSRPTELLLVLVPMLWGLDTMWVGHLFPWLKVVLGRLVKLTPMFLGIAAIGTLQLAYWKYASGEFLHMSYTGNEEGLDLLHPNILNVLFGFRKGWFVYTPMMVIAVAGLLWMRPKFREGHLAIAVFIAANIWVVSSWSNWWYSESFGHRGLMQSMAIMAVPLGAVLQAATGWTKCRRGVMGVMVSALIALNLFQTWQSAVGLIPGSRMTFSYYMLIFGKRHPIPDADRFLLVDRWKPVQQRFAEHDGHYLVRHCAIASGGVTARANTSSTAEPGATMHFEQADSYSAALQLPFDEQTIGHALLVHLQGVAECSGNADGAVVMTMQHHGGLYGYHLFPIRSKDPDMGSTVQIDTTFLTPELRSRGDSLSIYYWHRGGQVDLAPLDIKCYEPVIPLPF